MARRKSAALPDPGDDGLLIRTVGPWSKDKHHFLWRYINAFTSAMSGKPQFEGLHYIDLFAGAGIERLRGGGLEWGSPLLAAMSPRQFAGLHVCELDVGYASALSERLKRLPQPSPPRVHVGDANVLVHQLLANVPRRALSLAFVDPCQLSQLKFDTLRALAQRRTDIVVFFPDYTDALRALSIYRSDPESALSQYLGTREWEAEIERVSPQNRAAALVEVFKRQLRSLDYCSFEEERIFREDSRRLYKLVFASKDPTGGRIWSNVAKTKPDKQGRLF